LFDFADVVAAICDKMVRRHPHVFGNRTVASAAEQTRDWEAIKERERESGRRLLDDIPTGLPALTRAAKLGRRAATVGFDWPAPGPVRAKIDEELTEVDEALASGGTQDVEAELGDVLFAVVNLCRHAGVDPEQALRGANQRFADRFADVEAAVREGDRDWPDYDLEELDALWRAAKAKENGG
jgi:MazG family protein